MAPPAFCANCLEEGVELKKRTERAASGKEREVWLCSGCWNPVGRMRPHSNDLGRSAPTHLGRDGNRMTAPKRSR